MAEDMAALTGRAERLIDAIAGAMLATAEAAAERVELAGKVAMIQQRMAAFAAVLEGVGAQKAALEARAAALPPGALRSLLERQVEALTGQELAVLERAGVPAPAAQSALAGPCPTPPPPATLYRREGRRFTSAESNGRR